MVAALEHENILSFAAGAGIKNAIYSCHDDDVEK
jgi:hypothetical protein